MILTAIPGEQLDRVLDRFVAKLDDPFSRAVFRMIRATPPDRAFGEAAERHRQAALTLARSLGMAIHADGVECAFNWDGRALNGATEAYVILHEAAHFVLAPSERRRLVDFGLGPGPDTRDRDAAARAAVLSPLAGEADEAAASLLGIIWEAELGQPALASFLDQNWLEGLERSAHAHFSEVLDKLDRRGLLDLTRPAVFDRAATHRTGRAVAARTVEPDPFAEARREWAGLASLPRPAKLASIPGPGGPAHSPALRGGSPDLPSEPPGRLPVKHGVSTRVPRGRRESKEVMNRIDLGGRIAIVTGAARGIAIWDVDGAAAAATSLAVGNATYDIVDVADQAGIARAVEAVEARLGPPDILVNNAGISGPNLPLAEYPPEEWRRVVEIDLIGVFNCCRAILSLRQRRDYGRISITARSPARKAT
jgi:hypothetical protein